MEVEEIANLMMKMITKELSEQGIHLEYSKGLLEELGELGFHQVYGAREMRRVITDNVEDRIAQLIVTKKVKSGDTIVLNNLESLRVK